MDAVVDPAHGHQQLTFWHGYYDQNQYLPLVVTCADNDQFVMVALRPGNVHAAVGADDDLAYLVKRLRQVWPDALLQIRGDCGFGVPRRYDISESLDINCTFGLSSNAVLQRLTEDLLATAVATYKRRRQEARQHRAAAAGGTRAPVPGLLVCGGLVAPRPVCGGQGRSQRPGHEPKESLARFRRLSDRL